MRKAMVAQVEDIFTNNTALVLNRYLLDDIYAYIDCILSKEMHKVRPHFVQRILDLLKNRLQIAYV
jgi:hypothetical protein